MSLNALIAQGPRPIQIEDPVNQLAKVMQIQGAQQNQQLGQMKMDEYERGLADETQMRDLTRQAGGNVSKLRELAYGAGNYKQGLALDKTINEQKTATLKFDADSFKLANDRYGTFQKTMGALKDAPNLSKQLLMQVGQNLVQQGIIPASMYQGAVADMPDDPALLRQRLTQGLATQLPPEKVFELFAPKAEKIDNGASISFRDTNPNSPTFGQQTGGAPIQKQQSPDNVASVAASRENAAATRAVAASNVEAARIKGDRDTEMKLADDYRAQSKSFKEVSDAYKQINATLDKATTSPAATLAAATKFMKLLDPGSVVRESELGMALAASGVFDRATNYYQTLLRGKVLTPQQAEDFKNITRQIYGAAQTQQQLIDQNYRKTAETYKLRPETIVQDLGQSTGKPAASNIDSLLDKYK